MTIDKIKKIIAEKVDGIWESAHDGSGHRYRNTITGHLQRSVTTKLGVLSKPHLMNWAVKMGVEWLMKDERWKKLSNEHWKDEMVSGAQLAHTDVRDNAGAIGTVSHNMAERYINEWMSSGERPQDIRSFAPPNYDPRSIASARAIEAWMVKNDITPVASEILVGNIKFSAGTLDLLYLDNKNRLCLGDFKTSNAIDKNSYSMQVAAYKYFFEEMTGLKIYKSIILHVSKDYDKFDVYKVNNSTSAYKAFKNTCVLYDFMYSSKNKVEKDIKRISI